MNRLQNALMTNALFSSLSGLILIVLNRKWAGIFGLENATPFWVIGILLIFFSGTIVLEIKKQRELAIWWIIIQDFLWVLGSSVLLIMNPFAITSTGNLIIGTVAVIVLLMAINQVIALTKFKKSTN